MSSGTGRPQRSTARTRKSEATGAFPPQNSLGGPDGIPSVLLPVPGQPPPGYARNGDTQTLHSGAGPSGAVDGIYSGASTSSHLPASLSFQQSSNGSVGGAAPPVPLSLNFSGGASGNGPAGEGVASFASHPGQPEGGHQQQQQQYPPSLPSSYGAGLPPAAQPYGGHAGVQGYSLPRLPVSFAHTPAGAAQQAQAQAQRAMSAGPYQSAPTGVMNLPQAPPATATTTTAAGASNIPQPPPFFNQAHLFASSSPSAGVPPLSAATSSPAGGRVQPAQASNNPLARLAAAIGGPNGESSSEEGEPVHASNKPASNVPPTSNGAATFTDQKPPVLSAAASHALGPVDALSALAAASPAPSAKPSPSTTPAPVLPTIPNGMTLPPLPLPSSTSNGGLDGPANGSGKGKGRAPLPAFQPTPVLSPAQSPAPSGGAAAPPQQQQQQAPYNPTTAFFAALNRQRAQVAEEEAQQAAAAAALLAGLAGPGLRREMDDEDGEDRGWPYGDEDAPGEDEDASGEDEEMEDDDDEIPALDDAGVPLPSSSKGGKKSGRGSKRPKPATEDGFEYGLEGGVEGEEALPAPPPRKKGKGKNAKADKPKRGRGRPKGTKKKGKGKRKVKSEEEKARTRPPKPPPSHPGYVLQTLTCANKSISNPLASVLNQVTKCHECTTRRTGYTCLFRNIRSCPLDPDTGAVQPVSTFLDTLESDEVPVFPVEFDRPFTTSDAELLKSTAAEYLVPWLQRELAHAKRDNCPHIRRELAVTSTCDGCATALLAGSFLCVCCGRELCLDCIHTLDAVVVSEATDLPDGPTARQIEFEALDSYVQRGQATHDRHFDPPTEEETDAARKLPQPAVHKLRMCLRTRNPLHTPYNFVAVTRMRKEELERVLGEMEAWRKDKPLKEVKAGEVEQEWVDEHLVRLPEEENSLPVLHVPGQLLPAKMDEKAVLETLDPAQAAEKEEQEEDFSMAVDGLQGEKDPLVAAELADQGDKVSSASSAFAPPAGVLPPSDTATLPSPLTTSLPPSFASLPPSSHPQTAFFRALWARGEPFVVDLTPSSPSGWPCLPWTPEYLIEQYGSEPVTIGSNRPAPPVWNETGEAVPAQGTPVPVVPVVAAAQQQAGEQKVGGPGGAGGGIQQPMEGMEATVLSLALGGKPPERRSTVGEFFETFGKERGTEGGREEGVSEKIKDWPPAADFKNRYPALWHDFMSCAPAGSITRRDGVLNLSSHSPLNSNPPDLGPKGYFSHIADDKEGGWGSTKLHTLNLMVWSSPGPDGCPGVAIWDMYRAEDADKIRDFLYEHIAKIEGHNDLERAKLYHDDPIHTQQFFLDCKLRRELFEQKGVKAWRIHQRPGQVVFIPAGVAHQVCNFSDCIKVASDFISVENVARCWKVSDEFRGQTRNKDLWRSDVLQLKSALLWAWYSAERLEPKKFAEALAQQEIFLAEQAQLKQEQEAQEAAATAATEAAAAEQQQQQVQAQVQQEQVVAPVQPAGEVNGVQPMQLDA